MNTNPSQNNRVLSGMRPTGKLHLGHLHGVLHNWLELQHTEDGWKDACSHWSFSA